MRIGIRLRTADLSPRTGVGENASLSNGSQFHCDSARNRTVHVPRDSERRAAATQNVASPWLSRGNNKRLFGHGCSADLCRPRRYNVGAMARTKRPCRLLAFRCSKGGGGPLDNPAAGDDAAQTKVLNSKQCRIWLGWIVPSQRKDKNAEPAHHPKLQNADAVYCRVGDKQ